MPAKADPSAPARVRGTSRAVGIIGWPVEHSLSPVVHNAAFAAMEMDWVYVPLPVERDRLPSALDGLRSLGFAGANVTMPHKSATAVLVDTLSEDARSVNAVNTIVVEGPVLAGHNTDVGGFDRFLRRDAGFEPAGRSALIFGAGGAARACALALARAGLHRLVVAARDPDRAAELVATVDALGATTSVVPFSAAGDEPADLVVNATPLGAAGEELPTPPLGPTILVVDLLYEPAVTPLQATAKAAGATAFGGLGLLLHQAALSFELWTGQQPPLDLMSAAALAELGERR
jgi:shikimate dehydrogenase